MAGVKSTHWRKLDNAAKIFPATSNKRDVRVFRFYCELKEQVDGSCLQEALDRTVEKYPVFLSVMRKGLFWYYLEKSEQKPVASPESKPPCTGLYIRDRKSLLFEVTYFENRINFEVFHALTDGNGAVLFLKELVKNYLFLSHREEGLEDCSLAEEDLTIQDLESDGFSKYYSKKTSGGRKEKKKKKSFQLSGPRMGYGNLAVTEGAVSCSALLKKAKEYKVSITVFLTAVLLCAIHEEMSERQHRKPVVLMVPVNLRKYFPSKSMLNFFGWIEPGYCFRERDYQFGEVVDAVREYFAQELTGEQLGRRFSGLMGLECNPVLRFFPLELKNIGMQMGAQLAKGDVTAIFSNLGVITMPEEYTGYIERFGVYTSTPKIELSMCTFQDEVVLSFASSFQNMNVQRNFFRILKNLELESEQLPERFPEQKKPAYQGGTFFQWFSFLCLTGAVAAIMVNVIFTPKLYWSVFVLGGALSMWTALAVGFFKRHNLLKNGVWQMLLVSVASILWDRFTGWHGWSVDYVLPGVCLLILFSMLIITKVQKLPVQEYMIYYIIVGVFGLIPMILMLTGVVSVIYLSVICSGICFLFLAALLIFKGKDMFVELYKKLHF